MKVKLEAMLKKFENLCIAHATGGGASYEDYERERENLLSQPELLPHLPTWVSRCRSGGQFWALMKETSPTYAGRRKFIWDSLHSAYQWIARGDNPLDTPVETMLRVVSSETIASVWTKARERQSADPPGAITAARSMVESTCKHILDELCVAYENDGNLPKLYRLTAKNLKLGVDQHDEQVLKQILGACSSAVDGLASLRNKHGDAHGPGKKNLRPAVRHAALAVNLAGTLCSFFVATYEARMANQSDLVSKGNSG